MIINREFYVFYFDVKNRFMFYYVKQLFNQKRSIY